jgi:hypothetical protein
MTISYCRFIASPLLLLLLIVTTSAQAAVQTMNLDFGNAGAYVGAAGVLSSPGGTHWNEVTITSFSGGNVLINVPTLLDEFGQPFNLGPNPVYPGLPGIGWNLHNAVGTTSPGQGPLNDGIRIPGQGSFFDLSIRELSPDTPIDLVVYFNIPDPEQPEINAIVVRDPFSFPAPVSTVLPPTGFFPGTEGRSYLRFTDLTAYSTTIGVPELPGVIISVPFGSVANIAAIQIRGDFVSISPEPGSITMMLLAAGSFCALRRSSRQMGF